MATFKKQILGSSEKGAPILVAGNATGNATTIHTGSNVTTTYDEVWLYAMNTDTASRKLTIEWGGSTAGFLIEQLILPEAGLVLLAPGLLARGDSSQVVIKAFASTENVINITGYVNRITE
jgi:hypothetical protein